MCNHCQDNLAGSNKDRLKRHLLRCSKFLASTQAMNIAKTFSEITAAIEDYKQENKEVAELQQDAGTTPNSKSTRAGSGVVEDKGRFAKDLVKLIVDCNLPFNIVDNPTFKAFLATWVPAMPVPSRDQLSGPLLMALYANVMREVTQRLTRAQFFALTLDGWSRTQGSEHLLGFCAALPGGSSVFLDVVLTQDHSVTSDFMLAKITQILEKHNLTGKICGLVTDTPSSMQKLWCLVEAAMPKVLAMGCWAHILNLFFTDVKKLPRIFEHIEEAKDIVNLFARQVTPHEWLRNQQGPEGTALVPMCATRFSSMYKMLRSLQQNKQALINTVVLHGFDADERAKRIKSRVLSEAWWALNNCLVELMVPVAQLLTAIQADHANLADVHYGLAIVDKWFGDATRNVPVEFVDEVMELEQVFSKRMDSGHHVALYLAAVLDPRYRHKPHNLTVEEVLAAEELAAKLASADGKGKDAAGNAARLELLDTWLEPDYVVGMGLTMDRFAPDLTVDPVAWWRRYGKKLPHLQVVAQRVLSIPATSAATERLFSAFKFIWSDRRSRLLLGRMWIMSYVFFNTRVMTRKEHHASAEAQEEWESYMAAQVVLDAPQL
ncbi:hypothetical protein QJQ45_006832 [Haematococcus lacustris]|nr:hypothetical protein QJQ45_006832 [Haematococcus lacustris]